MGNKHLPDLVISLLSLVIFLPLNFGFMFLYFEPLARKRSYSNRDNSNSLVCLQIYQVVGMLVSSAFHSKSDLAKLLCFLTSGAFLLFYTFTSNSAIYNRELSKVWRLVSVINLWTLVCISVSMVC